ncbi:MAG: hypothetical protein LBM06_08560 [Prevotellaceae bacterium]|jgi:hypothetical protein|nr:hypothetical protein [Prevotellaceae bacterium]
MKKLLFLLLPILIVVISCVEDKEVIDGPGRQGFYYTKTYINQFIHCDTVLIRNCWLKKNDPQKELILAKEEILDQSTYHPTLYTQGWFYDAMPKYLKEGHIYYPISSSPGNQTAPNLEYRKRIEALGDTTFITRRNTIENLPFPYHIVSICTSPLRSVVITADKDFDNDYPAGANLSSRFTAFLFDVDALLKNDYQSTGDSYYSELREAQNDPGYFAYEDPYILRAVNLADANLGNYSLMESEWIFYLNTLPQRSDDYTFRIKLIFADGSAVEQVSKPFSIKGTAE